MQILAPAIINAAKLAHKKALNRHKTPKISVKALKISNDPKQLAPTIGTFFHVWLSVILIEYRK